MTPDTWLHPHLNTGLLINDVPCTWVLKLKLINLTELSEEFFLMLKLHTKIIA